MQTLKLTNLDYDFIPWEKIIPENKAETYKKFLEKNEIPARELKYLPELNPNHCYLFMDDCEISVDTKHAGTMSFNIKAGAFTDLASVPPDLRARVEHNDPHVKVAAIVLDFLYKTHSLDYDTSNHVFKELMRLDGAGWSERREAYKCVSTKVGRIFYDRYEFSQEDHKMFFKLNW